MTTHHTLKLPPLEIRPRAGDIGLIRWVVRCGGEAPVASVRKVKLSARRSDDLFDLPGGESVIVTDRPLPGGRPGGVSGVLLRRADNSLEWDSHSALDAVESRIASGEWPRLREEVIASWTDRFAYRAEVRGDGGAVLRDGLRPPQIGALHAVASHWSLFSSPATVVMPTGTGKTETMLAALVALVSGRLLVVVPSKALRRQSAEKFLTLGLLRSLGVFPEGALNPIVGIVNHRPVHPVDWDLIDPCHVVVATIGTVAQGTGADFIKELSTKCSTLILDEAHHVAAETWGTLRDGFSGKRVLQFTATPFRGDGKPVDGKVIYNYPLHLAQRDGYFQPIRFTPVFELDPDKGDDAVARQALTQLKDDLKRGFDHILLARCESKTRANNVHALYEELAAEHSPVVIHTDAPGVTASIEAIRNRRSRVVVCVDMLGEGFDLPQLKIAAVHDTHKSLGVLLQFVGRFTRTAGGHLGEATVVANIANLDLCAALEQLYSEDADWNKLLSEYSSDAVQDHIAVSEFLRKCERMGADDGDTQAPVVAPKALFPRLSAVAFSCKAFHPDKFHEGLDPGTHVECSWVNRTSRVLFFVTRAEPRVQWSSAKALRQRVWDLYVLYYNTKKKLLFVHSTNRETLHERLAKAVSKETAELVKGDTVFRCLGNIARLMFLNMGLRRHGRRNIRFSMHTGSDVAQALSPTLTANSTKSNLFATGYENGHPANVGCSYKGRLWSRDYGTIPDFMRWCDRMAEKLTDTSIKTDNIIENVLIPKQVTELPPAMVLCLDWPREAFERAEDTILLDSRHGKLPFCHYGIELVSYAAVPKEVRFRVVHDTHSGEFTLQLGGALGFTVSHAGGEAFTIFVGRRQKPLEEWFAENPPSILFVDGSELDGCDHIEPRLKPAHSFPPQRIVTWNWAGIDITKESMWKHGTFRTDSVQYRALTEQASEGFDVLFDDDSAGEIADLVCIREEKDAILLRLIHCKFAGKADPGERVKDAVEVCSQAVRSSRWVWRFKDLCKRLLRREVSLAKSGTATRFHAGDVKAVNRLGRASRFKQVRTEIFVVQPGVQQGALTEDQAMVLAAAHAYLLETVNVPLTVVCSP